MAYTPWDTYVDTIPVPTTIEELQQALQLKYNTTWPEIANQITSLGGDPTNFDELADLCGLGSVKSADGKSTMWYYKDTLDDFSYTPISSVSTNTYTSRSTVQTPMNTSIDDVTGKVTVSNTPKTGQFVQGAAYVMGEVGQATTAASVGIWLGKTIDSVLYNANPDFWDSVGMSSLNPETWASITSGDDSLGATLFNWVFGIDTDTGNVQGYLDTDAIAYLAYWLNYEGAFNSGGKMPPSDFPINISAFTPFDTSLKLSYSLEVSRVTYIKEYEIVPITGSYLLFKSINDSAGTYRILAANDEAGTIYYDEIRKTIDTSTGQVTTQVLNRSTYAGNSYTYNGLTAYSSVTTTGGSSDYTDIYFPNIWNSIPTIEEQKGIAWTMLYGETSGGIDGIGTQQGANLPDTSTWTDIPSTDTYLRSAYPNSYSDALQYDVMQPDGTVLTKTYVPVPMPENLTSPDTQHDNNPWNNPQPTSDNATQTTTEIDPSTSPDDFIKQLIKTITQTVQTTNTDNPTTTGTGESAPLVPIAGTSTALWSVYNPTKSQIDSFGAWLWTDNVIQQFIQLLNNPMEGIITLHKVFATPVISGTGTIVVGRLDSGVGSNLVSQQYVDVDCGSVRLDEYFGNVFDYSPHTTISLYLPFIGFVPLNVDDVMRSTISITYGVDVFTGACLATVNVDRDGNSVGLYQYSGVASVEYPLTGAQHGGLVNGLLGVAGGVAGIALASTGVGVVAGASAIAGGLTNAAKTSNARSGGFSGNAGAMGVKIPYLIIERPITKVANTFDILNGYPTNHDSRLGDCSGNVIVKYVHVEGINATEQELSLIESMLKSGVVV